MQYWHGWETLLKMHVAQWKNSMPSTTLARPVSHIVAALQICPSTKASLRPTTSRYTRRISAMLEPMPPFPSPFMAPKVCLVSQDIYDCCCGHGTYGTWHNPPPPPPNTVYKLSWCCTVTRVYTRDKYINFCKCIVSVPFWRFLCIL